MDITEERVKELERRIEFKEYALSKAMRGWTEAMDGWKEAEENVKLERASYLAAIKREEKWQALTNEAIDGWSAEKSRNGR